VKDIEDEIPFTLPEGWAWCRLGVICEISSSKRVLQKDWKKSGIPFYRAREITQLSNNEKVKEDLFITPELYKEIKQKYGVPEVGDLLVSAVGTIGKIYIVNESDCFYYKDASVICFSKKFKSINSTYLKLCCESSFIQKQMYSLSKGTTVDTITINKAQKYLFPLPPLTEQHRIVTKIERIFTQIDLLEQNKADLQTAVKQAKSKILDLAIHGKLVPQDPDDEPASVMLEKLRAEKEAKIASGEIKRGKNDSYIYKNSTDNCYYQKYADGCEENISDEIPFDVPVGWVWCRLAEISEFISRGKTPVYTKESQYPVLAQKCNQWDGIRLDKVLFLDPNSLSKWTNEYHLQHEDIIINSTGTGTIGRVGIFDIGILGKYPFIVPDSHISIVRCYKAYIYQKYIYTVFTSEYLQNKINKTATGSTNQKELPKNVLVEFFLPLPPLAEQKRIVAKIEELFAKLDFITTTLTK